MNTKFSDLKKKFRGEIFTDDLHRMMYATDASIYRELPLMVCYPRDKDDIKALLEYACSTGSTIIPRTAGTSLAGQVVGNGIVMDISRYFRNILELNVSERWVKVEPGVILDLLNAYLKPCGLFFGPETSTSNRCMIGGMIGNNSCGARSRIYGSVRDHLLEVDVILSDGSETTFKFLSPAEFEQKCTLQTLEGHIYRSLASLLNNADNKQKIQNAYPNWKLKRRNTGYALDVLLRTEIFGYGQEQLNLSKLIAGSEGTLAIVTAAKLNLVDLPPSHVVLLCVHFGSIHEALEANVDILRFNPTAVELLDGKILNLTKNNLSQQKNRFFVVGEPQATLIVEFAAYREEEVKQIVQQCLHHLKQKGFGYAHVVVEGSKIRQVWELRKAGLGVLTSDASDKKAQTFVEDVAVLPEQLPAFVRDVEEMLMRHKVECVYYAHVATGEIHLKPILNLKESHDVRKMRMIAEEMVDVVKKYGGSLSGEHGDGRLRGEFLEKFFGTEVYQMLRIVKKTFDPHGVLNAGKIVDAPRMDTNLRTSTVTHRSIQTFLKFREQGDLLHAVERCNGSADCRRTAELAHGMCPSYMATLNEQDTTRARANLLREFLSHQIKGNPFHHKELYEVLDLCIMCKACKSDCPSGIDMATYKMEFLYQWYQAHPPGIRTLMIAHMHRMMHIASKLPRVYNFFMKKLKFEHIVKYMLSFAPQRSLPVLHKNTLRALMKKHILPRNNTLKNPKGKVILFIDEFSNYHDVEVGYACARLLQGLGYHVLMADHLESGRTYLSKGLLKTAHRIAQKNIQKLSNIVQDDLPLVGIEPSTILCFRDEYLHLCDDNMLDAAQKLASRALLLEEFFVREIERGHITTTDFTDEPVRMVVHGHCHQKALAGNEKLLQMLSFPMGNEVLELKTGCCGMAGSFGYEKEHYEVSMKIGSLHIFPQIHQYASDGVLIVAPGTSCRQQIQDGTGRKAFHPAQVLLLKLKI